MQIEILKSKIHRATVTQSNLDYEGSITIDKNLMEAADIIPYEKVLIANITNGERLETYVIEGEAGSGIIGINGAGARKCDVGDLIIVMSFCTVEKVDPVTYYKYVSPEADISFNKDYPEATEIIYHKYNEPKLVFVNDKNEII